MKMEYPLVDDVGLCGDENDVGGVHQIVVAVSSRAAQLAEVGQEVRVLQSVGSVILTRLCSAKLLLLKLLLYDDGHERDEWTGCCLATFCVTLAASDV